MTRRLVFTAFSLFIGFGQVFLAEASTIRSLSFGERVSQAALIVVGRVVKLETVTGGSDPTDPMSAAGVRQAQEKETRAPSREPGEAEAQGEPIATAAPVSVGVEGGTMLFTRVTFAVEEEIFGIAGRELIFQIAGGVSGGQAVVVEGMPSFEQGQRYLLLLRSGFENTGAPIVGVHQGYFEVVRNEVTGEDILLNANGDIVLGVEKDEVIVRHNSARATRPVPQLGPAPVPEAGSTVEALTSPEVARYWQSTEPPMSASAFKAAILTAKGVAQ